MTNQLLMATATGAVSGWVALSRRFGRLPFAQLAQPARQVAAETDGTYGGVLYVDSLSDADGPVPTYLELLRMTTETIAKGLSR